MNWDNFRQDWQEHIQNIYKLVDKHSELAVKTGDPFHEKQYKSLARLFGFNQKKHNGASF